MSRSELVREGSTQLMIFMALRELVDQRRIAPSRDPDAKNVSACVVDHTKSVLIHS